jgi:glycerol-3-phosphate dehydrogenase
VRRPLSDLASTSFDLLVIGAGINGTGIARDAARRGLRVLVVDKADIASGTTSWSSRLIHGGLRYLEHAEIGLVHESLQERERLLHIAPHLVKPLPLTLPIYKHHKRGPLMIRAGMIAYDTLSWNKSLPRHHMYSAKGALDHEPGLNPDAIAGAARYYDAQVEFPERLSLESALDAIEYGADVRTWTEVVGFHVEAGVVRGAIVRDMLTGEEATVWASVTVNVAGPWVDAVLQVDPDLAAGQRHIGATKGTHIVVDPFPGAPSDALYVEATQDGRPYFIIPWNDLYLIGTTDTRFDGDLDEVDPTEDEISYLLTETNIAIPSAGLTRDSVRYAYAGLRPLPFQKAGSEGAITRRHVIHDHTPRIAGLISIIGGKLTTFRSLAELTVDAVAKKLGRNLPKSDTGASPLPGAGNFTLAQRPQWLREDTIIHLARVYGSRASTIVDLADREPGLRDVIHEPTGAIAAEVVFAVEVEFAATLQDILFRRTMIGYGRDAGQSALDEIERLLIGRLDWDIATVATQRADLLRFWKRSKVNSAILS